MEMNRRTKFAFLAVAVVALAAGIGAMVLPATIAGASTCTTNCTANGGPVTATATVGSSISLTGVSATVAWPTATAGATATATGAEKYVVSTNDTAGYSLSIAPLFACFSTTSGQCVSVPAGTFTIPNSALSIAEQTTTLPDPGAGTTVTWPSTNLAGSMVIHTSTAATAGDNYLENWLLAVPAGQQPGAYSGQFTFTALAS